MTRPPARAGVLALALLSLAVSAPALARGAEPADACRVRQPVALAFSTDGSRLFVANRRSGSLSVIDPRSSKVVAEADVGRGLADVAPLPDGRHVLAVDQEGDALILVGVEGDTARVIEARGVSPDPVGVVVLAGGERCAVTSRGSRRLTFLELVRSGSGANGRLGLVVTRTLDLPFRPRNVVELSGRGRLVVADAFGGKLGVVDLSRGTLVAVRRLPGHNIRGLAVSPDGRSLAVAHQVLERSARTVRDDVHWGALLRNTLRVLSVDAVLRAGSDEALLHDGREAELDSFGNGAGDPSAVAFDRAGGVVVALGGVGEVALGSTPTGQLHRVDAGRRPSALAVGPDDDGAAAFVADSAGDAVWVVDLPAGHRRRAIRLGRRPEPDAAERGERLFFDAGLSHDRWMSCHSCHTDGQTSGRLADTLGDGTFGTPKLVPPLLGVGATGPWGWDGSVTRLEDQVRKSVGTTMQGRPPTDAQVNDLTAYLRSLKPPRPPAPAGPVADPDGAVGRGLEVFRTRRCGACHAPPDYTSPGRHDVGLADESGRRAFNPPSLRGVGAREPLLHDGRASTLEDVFLRFQHPRGLALPAREVADLVAFLRTL
jgi:YVTN family beta-propeller protein